MKTRKRRQDPDAEYNFWQPATDMMSALVYVLLLIIALLGLYLLSDYTGLEEPSSSSEEAASSGWHDDDYDGWHDGGVIIGTAIVPGVVVVVMPAAGRCLVTG